jgi:uncharacterized repeat protein (TIGR01451 family)
MKKISSIFKLLQHVPKKTAVLFGIMTAVLIPAAIMAWGPVTNRPALYWRDGGTDHVVFNSFVDNPQRGDERTFARIKESGTNNSAYARSIKLVPGKTYDVLAYYHNNAANNLNDAAHNYAGVAQGAYLRVQKPDSVNGSSIINVFIGANNATPREVWDTLNVTSDGKVDVTYVSNSAFISNLGSVNGQKLPNNGNNLFASSGQLIGYNALDGKVPGCNEFSGYVVFQIRVSAESKYDFSKQVRLLGTADWKENVKIKPGDTVEYLLHYKNTSQLVTQENVVLSDTLPTGMTYVPNSTKLKNLLPAYQNGAKISDGITTATGVNIGTYAPNAEAYVWFQATADSSGKVCSTLTNVGHANVGGNKKNDTADVEIDCPNPVAKYTCDLLGVNKLERTKFEFSTAYTVENATFKSVTYIVRNKDGQEVARQTVTGTNTKYTYTQVASGDYSVEAIVTVATDGGNKTATSDSCKKQFRVEPPDTKPEYICELLTADRATIEKGDSVKFTVTPKFNGDVTISEVKMDFGDASTAIQNGYADFNHTYNRVGQFTARAWVSYRVNGRLETVTSNACEKLIKVKEPYVPPVAPPPSVPNTPSIPNTPSTPSTPSTTAPPPPSKGTEYIPATGPETAVFGLAGGGALTYAGYSWLSSRRTLRRTSLKR